MLGGTQEQPGADPHAAGPDRLLKGVPRTSDRGLVLAVVPAHNEQERIGTALGSLAEQSSPPSSILVCADNCTDGTALAAQAAGASVFETQGNEHGRAGALNQGLELLLPVLRDDDAVLITTAGFVLADSFLAESRRRLERGVGGVGDVLSPLDGAKLIARLREEQYAIFARDLAKLRDQALILTGEATLFSSRALWHVLMARAAGLLPGNGTHVFNVDAANPDTELTLALVHLGYRIISSG